MISRKHLLVMIGLLAASFVVAACACPFLPALAPIHWDLHDHPNGYAPRAVAALLFPLINLVTAALLFLIPLLRPMKRRFVKMRRVYGIICVAVAAAMLGIQSLCMLAGAGVPLPIGQAIMIVIGILYAVLGNFMSKVRQNYFFGIRTPWTLASEFVWERVHRAGSLLFVGLGVVVIAIAIIAPPSIGALVLIVGTVIVTAWAFFYSAWLYRHRGGIGSGASK